MKVIQRRAVASLGASLLVISILGVGAALANPKEGTVAPSARVEDAEARGLELKTLKGKAFMIVYDDRASSPKSEALRAEVVKLVKSSPGKAKVALVFVADVSPYGFWPAKGIVIDAVREETKKQGTTVYCDWTGDLRKAYSFKGGVSNVVLVGKDGSVAVALEGVPSGAAHKRLFDALHAALEEP